MKKDLGYFVSLIFILFASGGNVLADDIVLPDFRFRVNQRLEKISENADKVVFQTVRNNHSFEKFFDKLEIEIYKKNPEKEMTPSYFGQTYIARNLTGDLNGEKYTVMDENDEYIGIWCSQRAQKCEIIRVINGFDGLISIKYVHNNLWHFQNNIGSFIEVVRRTSIYPYEFTIRAVCNDDDFVRL